MGTELEPRESSSGVFLQVNLWLGGREKERSIQDLLQVNRAQPPYRLACWSNELTNATLT